MTTDETLKADTDERAPDIENDDKSEIQIPTKAYTVTTLSTGKMIYNISIWSTYQRMISIEFFLVPSIEDEIVVM